MLTIQIYNDGTGKNNIGNYNYKIYVNKNCIEEGRIEGHKRQEGWRELLRKLVYEAKDIKDIEGLSLWKYICDPKYNDFSDIADSLRKEEIKVSSFEAVNFLDRLNNFTKQQVKSRKQMMRSAAKKRKLEERT